MISCDADSGMRSVSRIFAHHAVFHQSGGGTRDLDIRCKTMHIDKGAGRQEGRKDEASNDEEVSVV
jgi:hypothetical protein